MDEAVIKQIQREGADALLDIGVSVPLKAFHIPFRKSPLELRVTMRRPYMSGQILLPGHICRWGSPVRRCGVQQGGGNAVSGLSRQGGEPYGGLYPLSWPFSRRVLLRPVAWLIRNFMEQRYLVGAIKRFVSLMGTDPLYLLSDQPSGRIR